MFSPFGALTVNEFATNSPTVFGHKNAAGAHTVGAAFYGSTPECGTTPPVLEDFSSSGGVRILFDTSGARLDAPVVRQKPNSVAPDGINTNFFGDESFADPVGACSTTEPFPNFFGTSAAAPHAAAVAALLLDADPLLTPAAIYAILENTAINMGPTGFDFETGFGLIQADAAVASVANAGSVQLSATTYAVGEDGRYAIITVTRTGGSAGAISVNFATKSDSAVFRADYRGINQAVTFGDGDNASKTIRIRILQDTRFEGDERFGIILGNPIGGATLGSPRSAIVTISDDDSAPIGGVLQFSAPAYRVSESGGNAVITIARSDGSTGAVRVNFATMSRRATVGSDYTGINRDISFASGDTAAKTVNVPILQDTRVEGKESLVVRLAKPTGGAMVGSQGRATVTIMDDD
ncbi:MAG: S8 family serine peptidase [Burkholderiales bacterium]|nr:S8 family serine peptidase [Burkholderiales bacterium]